MAGIGFELKKIFDEESVLKIAGGVAYSTLVTVGPTIIVIVTILILFLTLGFSSILYSDRELLSATILYVFIFSLLVTAPYNGVMSRFIADKIYDEDYDDILPSFYMGILLNTISGAIIGIPFTIRLVLVGGVDPMYSFVAYCFFITMIINFYSMIYLSATKDYKIIAIYYGIGMAVTFVLSFVLNWMGLPTIKAILYGITIGFLFISFLEFSYIRNSFRSNSKNYTACLRYFVDHKGILFCNFFYILGLYIHNFVFWTHPSRVVIAKSFVVMQSYDMATTLGMFTNISTIIIFTVMVETTFHDKYQKYMESVIGKTLSDINKDKKSMFRLLINQNNYLAIIQVIITIIIFLINLIILPRLGFGGSILRIYGALVAAYFTIFLMYSNIIFLFYFDENKGAMLTSIVFCLSVMVGSFFSMKSIETFYGLGVCFGAIVGYTFSFFRLKYLERNFDEHIFCQATMMKKIQRDVPKAIVYKRD